MGGFIEVFTSTALQVGPNFVEKQRGKTVSTLIFHRVFPRLMAMIYFKAANSFRSYQATQSTQIFIEEQRHFQRK